MSCHLALIGFMGTGKTTVGRLLGAQLALPFYDTDEQIVSRTGRTVASWFATSGEDAFRRTESEILVDMLALPPCVIATGGGVPLRACNRERLQKQAFVVALCAEESDIVHRIEGDPERPLIKKGANDIVALLQSRKEIYAFAHTTIHTSHVAPEMVAEQIARQYRHFLQTKDGELDMERV